MTRFKISLLRVVSGVKYVFLNFAVPIVFYLTFRKFGSKPAIIFAIAVVFLQLFGHWLTSLKPSIFFLVAAIFTVSFGTIDVFIADPKYFRLEPFAQNLIMSVLFVATAFTDVPIVGRFIAALPERVKVLFFEGLSQTYLRKLTLIWAVYLFVKAFVFLYLALNFDLGQLIILRSVLGGGSLALMALGEVAYRKIRNGRPPCLTLVV